MSHDKYSLTSPLVLGTDYHDVGIILVKGKKVLMQLRDDDPMIRHPGCWCIPTGGIEEQDWAGSVRESAKLAARREMAEELLVKNGNRPEPFVPNGLRFASVSTYHHPDTGRAYQHVLESGLYLPPDQLIVLEGQGARLMDRDQFNGVPVAPNYRHSIEKYFDRL